MSDACECDKTENQKNKWNKKFGFVKKKKKKESKSSERHLQESSSCPVCAQKESAMTPEQCMVDIYEEKQKLRAETIRDDLNHTENNPYVSPRPICNCTKCRRYRGEDPLTVELLPMDAQVTLQSTLQDTVLMCSIS